MNATFTELRIMLSILCGLVATVGCQQCAVSESETAPPHANTAGSSSSQPRDQNTPGNTGEKKLRPHALPQGGIGVLLRIENGNVFVARVLPESPAAETDTIKRNDQVIAIGEGDGLPTQLLGIKDVAQAVGMIRGPIGSVIRLSIIPTGKSEGDQIVVSLIRGDVKQITTHVDGRLLPVRSKAPNFNFTPLAHCTETELAQFQGRIAVVEFWATWCGPCVRSLSDIDSMYAAHPEWGKKVSIIAISVDDTKEAAAALLAQSKWSNVSFGWTGPDVIELYRFSGLPTVYIIDQAGRVVAVDHRLDIPALIKPLFEQPHRAD